MMSCRHAKVIALPAGVWGRCKVLRAEPRGGPGVGATEAPKIQEFLTVKMGYIGIVHNNVGNCLENLPRGEKRLDVHIFFNASVACIINRTLRKHNTNEVKDSVIFLQTNISWLYHSSLGL